MYFLALYFSAFDVDFLSSVRVVIISIILGIDNAIVWHLEEFTCKGRKRKFTVDSQFGIPFYLWILFKLSCVSFSGIKCDKPPEPKGQVKKKYIIIDFNAWEYFADAPDEFWAALVKIIYEKVEKQFGKELNSVDNPDVEDQYYDGKLDWRTRKALNSILESYGEVPGTRNMILSVCAIFLIIVWYFLLPPLLVSNWKELLSKVDSFPEVVSVLTPLTGSLLAFYNLFGSIISASKAEGDAVLENANSLSNSTANQEIEKLGFMTHVKEELEKLFKFMKEDYRCRSNIDLRLLLFIDDLDRCLGGGNVKMLEALQLIVHNAQYSPVITFLSMDSRTVIASLEHHLNKSMCIDEAMITGWEYLEKFVQLPFYLPEVSEVKIERFVRSSVTPIHMEYGFLRKSLSKLLVKCAECDSKKSKPLKFKVFCRFSGDIFIPFEKLKAVDEKYDKKELSKKNDFLQALARHMQIPFRDNMDNQDLEGWEILCQKISSALKESKIGYARTEKTKDEGNLLEAAPYVTVPNQDSGPLVLAKSQPSFSSSLPAPSKSVAAFQFPPGYTFTCNVTGDELRATTFFTVHDLQSDTEGYNSYR